MTQENTITIKDLSITVLDRKQVRVLAQEPLTMDGIHHVLFEKNKRDFVMVDAWATTSQDLQTTHRVSGEDITKMNTYMDDTNNCAMERIQQARILAFEALKSHKRKSSASKVAFAQSIT